MIYNEPLYINDILSIKNYILCLSNSKIAGFHCIDWLLTSILKILLLPTAVVPMHVYVSVEPSLSVQLCHAALPAIKQYTQSIINISFLITSNLHSDRVGGGVS